MQCCRLAVKTPTISTGSQFVTGNAKAYVLSHFLLMWFVSGKMANRISERAVSKKMKQNSVPVNTFFSVNIIVRKDGKASLQQV